MITNLDFKFEPVNLTPNDYKSELHPIWCPGCGDFGVLASFYKAVSELHIPQEQLVVVSGIGCSSRFPAFVNAYGLHGTHGRALPLATGVKMAHPELQVVTVGGDGDAFSIGMGHLPHAIRRNVDITYIVMDNEIYGLTKGQASPTSPVGMERKASPYGTIEKPLNPLMLALASGVYLGCARFFQQTQRVDRVDQTSNDAQGLFAVASVFAVRYLLRHVRSFQRCDQATARRTQPARRDERDEICDGRRNAISGSLLPRRATNV